MKKSLVAVLVVVLSMITGVSAVSADGHLATIAEIAVNDGRFTTLVAAASEAGLVDELSGQGPWTVFAPTDAAFAALLADLDLSASELLASDQLGNVLKYHIKNDTLMAADVVSRDSLFMYNGERASVELRNGSAYIANARIVVTDIEASNGVIHVIDAVMVPPSFPVPSAAAVPAASSSADAPTIAEIAVADGRFNTLVAAAQETGLVSALANKGKVTYTVFAPTDAAFGALLSELGISASDLLASPNLADILKYHVKLGSLGSADVVSRSSLAMLNGDRAEVELRNGGAYIADAQIIITDIQASNGIIHVIDAVMLPPS
jgi:uncharacterized surface protein with fasciclin (FAS1) repeats